ncbi:hypothetical protein [Aquimarina algiphila]|uniref:hypothetical protein n=1 Tax=Aquimarina algiphila TaxID=2047982 RepID=UPI00232E5679|nr:hypothetical protein [Aquimarina algiphila]
MISNSIKISVIILLVLILPIKSHGQDTYKQETVKKTLLTIFELCEQNKCDQLAPYIVYRGKDSKRKWKDTCNSKNKEELERVQNICHRIQEFQKYDDYEFSEFITQEESEGKWYVWKLTFNTKETPKIFYFAFLNINGSYAIGDIDG